MIKKARWLLMVWVFLFIGPVGAFGQYPKDIKKPDFKLAIKKPIPIKGLICSLPIPLCPQETSMWCWAASGEMVMQFVQPGLDVKQCEEANRYFTRTDCCNSPVPGPCISGGWDVLASYGFSFNRKEGSPLSWEELNSQICANKPVMFAWAWDGGGGHMMVVTGISELIPSHQRFVHINNPWPPILGDTQVISYDAWVNGDGYSFWAVYYDIQKKITKTLYPLLKEKLTRFPLEKTLMELNKTVDIKYKKLAVEGLKSLNRLVTEENAQAFGFYRKIDAGQTTVGRPIREFRIQLDDLRSFLPTDDPKKIIRGGQRLLFPVLSSGQISSAVRIDKYKETDRVHSYGNATLIKIIEGMVGSKTLNEDKLMVPLSTLEIPAIGLYFLTKEEAGKLWITSVFDEPSFGLKKGTYEPALDVYKRLQPFAKIGIFAPMR